ncbi:MAG: hypothetical protein HY319_01160 [Armatimonadetes bacterium]|nr:hypothetical protein [Armatimonadota bacterium]
MFAYRSATRKKGSILLLALFFMVILFLIALAMFKLVPTEFQAAHRSKVDLMAHYVANAGVRNAVAWLEQKMRDFDASGDITVLPDYSTDGTDYPNIETYLAGGYDPTPFASDEWSYTLTVTADQSTQSEVPNFAPKVFRIRSIAFLRGEPIRQVDVQVRQASFAAFAFFTDNFDGGAKFVIDGETGIRGPVHTNDYLRFEVNSAVWDDDDAEPYFLDEVTHSSIFSSSDPNSDGNEYLGGQEPWDAVGPIDSRYAKLFEEGRNALKLKEYIQLPSSSSSLGELAFGDSTGFPSIGGVYVSEDSGKVKAGAYIKGDLELMHLRLDEVGNQKTQLRQNLAAGTRTVTRWRSVPYDPPQFYTHQDPIYEWQDPPSGGGGVEGGRIQVLVGWSAPHDHQRFQSVPDGTYETTDYDLFDTEIYEVTESPVTIPDENGENVTAAVGETLIVTKQRDDEAGPNFNTVDVKVLDGQPNGVFYTDGNVKDLWGIAKGSAVMDDTGSFVEDDGQRVYRNKTVATNIGANNYVELRGDLLQFSQTKFDSRGGGSLANQNQWKLVALDPNATTDGEWTPELSPDADHVVGIISKDIWMRGPKNAAGNNDPGRAANDGYYDVYAVMLAGKTRVDGSGNPVMGADGHPITSGGFGTRQADRDAAGDGLGQFRIIGGVIQATADRGPEDPANGTHYWRTGSVGYNVQMFYDLEATRQGIFPTYPEFAIVRYLERARRD